MQEIHVVHYCDYPDCRATAGPEGQEVSVVEVMIYTPGKGRKPRPIRVELCEKHREEVRGIYDLLKKYDQGVSEE